MKKNFCFKLLFLTLMSLNFLSLQAGTGCSKCIENCNKNELLEKAIYRNDINKVTKLLNKYPKLINNQEFLDLAVDNFKPELVKLFLERRAVIELEVFNLNLEHVNSLAMAACQYLIEKCLNEEKDLKDKFTLENSQSIQIYYQTNQITFKDIQMPNLSNLSNSLETNVKNYIENLTKLKIIQFELLSTNAENISAVFATKSLEDLKNNLLEAIKSLSKFIQYSKLTYLVNFSNIEDIAYYSLDRNKDIVKVPSHFFIAFVKSLEILSIFLNSLDENFTTNAFEMILLNFKNLSLKE